MWLLDHYRYHMCMCVCVSIMNMYSNEVKMSSCVTAVKKLLSYVIRKYRAWEPRLPCTHLFRQNARHEAYSRDENAKTEIRYRKRKGRDTGEQKERKQKKREKRKELDHTLVSQIHHSNKKKEQKNGREKKERKKKQKEGGRKLSLGYTLGTHEKEEKNLGSSSKSSALTGTYHSFFGQRLWLRLYGGCGMPNDRSFEW